MVSAPLVRPMSARIFSVFDVELERATKVTWTPVSVATAALAACSTEPAVAAAADAVAARATQLAAAIAPSASGRRRPGAVARDRRRAAGTFARLPGLTTGLGSLVAAAHSARRARGAESDRVLT